MTLENIDEFFADEDMAVEEMEEVDDEEFDADFLVSFLDDLASLQ